MGRSESKQVTQQQMQQSAQDQAMAAAAAAAENNAIGQLQPHLKHGAQLLAATSRRWLELAAAR